MNAVKWAQIPVVPLTNRKEKMLSGLLETYRSIVQESIEYAVRNNVTSRKRLHEALYHKLRDRYPDLASHHICTGFTMALGIVRSFRRKRLGLTKKYRPEITNLNAIMLDGCHLFKIRNGVLDLNLGRGH